MTKFIIRRFFSLLLTMFLTSIVVFILAEISPGNVARNILGTFITPEQEASFIAQVGLDKPFHIRYLFWMFGSDWYASRLVGMPLKRITTQSGLYEWWAVQEDGSLIRWQFQEEGLSAIVRGSDGRISKYSDNETWKVGKEEKAEVKKKANTFWGVDTENRVVKWEKDLETTVWTFRINWIEGKSNATEFIPLQKGFLRGDPGISLMTGRPVSKNLFVRFQNSMVLAGIAFIIVMPLALLLGVIAGLREGSLKDRILSVGATSFSVIPEFSNGIFLILIMAMWLNLVPGVTMIAEKAPWERLDMLILPVLTLTMVEVGYVLRITRASMIEVMKAPYVRTAILKGLPYWHVVLKHAVRNALIAPITVIMLHLRWLVGGLVIVEVVFSYPGLGTYLLEAALYKDFNAIEAGTMIMVAVCVGAQLIADIIYTFLNPRIRYK